MLGLGGCKIICHQIVIYTAMLGLGVGGPSQFDESDLK